MESKSTLIEFYAGPGSGKTTESTSLFSFIKRSGIHCEFIREIATEKILRDRAHVLKHHQLSMISEYIERIETMERLGQKIFILDSSIDLGLYYSPECVYREEVERIIKKFYSTRRRIKIFVEKNLSIEHTMLGRVHTREQSLEIDRDLQQIYRPFDYTIKGKSTLEENNTVWDSIASSLK